MDPLFCFLHPFFVPVLFDACNILCVLKTLVEGFFLYWSLFELTRQSLDKSSNFLVSQAACLEFWFFFLNIISGETKNILLCSCTWKNKQPCMRDGYCVLELTDDICEQQGQGESEEWCRQGCALPVAAAVGLVEGEQRSGHTAARERPGRRGVHRPRCQRVALPRPWQ